MKSGRRLDRSRGALPQERASQIACLFDSVICGCPAKRTKASDDPDAASDDGQIPSRLICG